MEKLEAKVMKRIRVLIAEDSALMRKYLVEIISSSSLFEVIHVARNGEEAVNKTLELKPDVVAMDINMPIMDGISAMQMIMMKRPTPVVMISSLTQRGALTTLEALELGAIDYVSKPEGTISINIRNKKQEILEKLENAANSNIKQLRIRSPQVSREPYQKTKNKLNRTQIMTDEIKYYTIIGVSTGGPNTLLEILPHLPENFPSPVIVVQHMPEKFTASFAQRLHQYCKMSAKEAITRDVLEPGTIYVAKGNKQIHFEKKLGSDRVRIRLSDKPTTIYTPSIHNAMSSLTTIVPYKKTIGVLLTGIGDDGADMMVKIRQNGGYTIAESHETAVVYGMPKEAYQRGGAEWVLPCNKIAQKLLECVEG